MNTKFALVAAVAAVTGFAAHADVSVRGYNVLSCEGVSASGFTVVQGGKRERFVTERSAERYDFSCSDEPLIILPAGLDHARINQVTDYLVERGYNADDMRFYGTQRRCTKNGEDAQYQNCDDDERASGRGGTF